MEGFCIMHEPSYSGNRAGTHQCIISGIADKNSPAVFNHYCPRKGPHTEIYVATKSFGKEIVVIL